MKSTEPTAEALREAAIAHARTMLAGLLRVLSAQSIPVDYHQTLMETDKLIEQVTKL